jgi:type II secretory pathway component PulF
MPFRLAPSRDEFAADRMLDLASSIDAGLSPQAFGGEAADGDEVLAQALLRRGAPTAAGEQSALRAAWRTGRASAGLRRIAERRRLRAASSRQLRAKLRYPLALSLVALVVSFVAARVGSTTLPWVLGSTLAILLALAVWIARQARAGTERALALPGLGPLLADLAELPYLETLHACYASGVPLLAANKEAVAACPFLAVRQKLCVADLLAQQGRGLTESLSQARAVHPETLTVLGVGEQSGTLEEALSRAIQRRRDAAERRASSLAGLVGSAMYALGVVAAVATILSFYWGYASMLRQLR